MSATATQRSGVRLTSLRAEFIALGVGVVLVLAAFVSEPLWIDVHARFPPLSALLEPALAPGRWIAAALGLLGIIVAPRLATVLPWRSLLWVTWAAGLAWGVGLALVRGWSGITEPLTNPAEYLADIDRAAALGPMLSGFAEHIVYSDPDHWTTQVAGHPPLSFLFYIGLDRVGLGGPAWGGVITTLIGSTGIVAVLVTLRALRDQSTARRAAPFLAFTPAVIWMVVSADAIFLAVSAWSIALGALAVTSPDRRRATGLAAGCGIGLGLTLFLSYGLVLMLPVAAAVLILRSQWWAILPAALGAGAVTLSFAAAGFWWFEGQSALVIRYYEGIGADRPYSYWIWANIAVLCIAVGPAVIAGVGAAVQRARHRASRLPASYWLATAALLGMLLATLSGLSKSEVERIWLPFLIWVVPLAAAASPRTRRFWLASQVVAALGIAVLLDTSW